MIDIDISTLDRLLSTLRSLQSGDYIPSALKRFAPYIRNRTFDRYLQATKTPYAQSSLGTRKPVSKVRRGSPEDPGFGIDSGKVLSDLASNQATQELTRDSLSIWTDASYGLFLEALYQQKGPFAPDGVLFMDDSDWVILEEMVGLEVGGVLE